MIQGFVENMQAQVNVTFRLPGQPDFQIAFVVDTGFEGALTLPSEVVDTLGLPYFGDLRANLADDSNTRVDVYVASIMWEGVEQEVAILAMGKRPLLGTALLPGRYLGIDFREGGEVVIQKQS